MGSCSGRGSPSSPPSSWILMIIKPPSFARSRRRNEPRSRSCHVTSCHGMTCPPPSPSCTIDRTGQQRHADIRSEDEPPERSSLRKSADDEHGIQRPPSSPPPPLHRLSSTADESTPARLVDGQAKHKQTKSLRSKSRAMFCLSLSPSSSAPFRPSHRGRNIVSGEGAFCVSGVWREGSSGGRFWKTHHDDFIREKADATSRYGGTPKGQGRAGEGENSPAPSRRRNRIEGVSSLIGKRKRKDTTLPREIPHAVIRGC
jgi:hypothetical protein